MTSRYVYDRQEELVEWAQERIDHCQFREDAVAIGHERHGTLVGVVVYDTWSPQNAFVHIASDGSRRWFTREFAIRAMAFPFQQAGCSRISCIISAGNKASLAFTRGFGGWVEEGRLREAAPGLQDIILFGMLRRECVYLPENNAKLFPGRAPAGPRHPQLAGCGPVLQGIAVAVHDAKAL